MRRLLLTDRAPQSQAERRGNELVMWATPQADGIYESSRNGNKTSWRFKNLIDDWVEC